MNKKKLLLLVAVLTLALVASVILWLVVSKSNNESGDKSKTNVQSTKPERVEAPKDFDSKSLVVKNRETSFDYSDTIINPNSVATNPNDYLDKKITVRGWIVKPGDDLFLITSINSDEQNGLILAKSDSLNFSEYTNGAADSAKASSPVTIVGMLVPNESSGNIEFVAESLSQ